MPQRYLIAIEVRGLRCSAVNIVSSAVRVSKPVFDVRCADREQTK